MSDSQQPTNSAADKGRNSTTKKSFLDGEYIFREGETGGHAYILDTGNVDILKSSPSGQLKVADVDQGALFGEMALIDSAARSASALVVGGANVTEVNKRGFLAYISSNPEMAFSLMTRLSGYVRDLNESVSRLENKFAEARSGSTPDETSVQSEARIDEDRLIALAVSDTEAIYEQPASKFLFGMVFAILGFLFFFLVFSMLVSVDTTVSTRGKITTTVPNVVVQAPASARVDALLASQGDFINEGTVVAQLDETIVSANLKIIQDKLAAAFARKKRLEFERGAINTDEEVPLFETTLDDVNGDILLKRVEEYRSRLVLFEAQLAQNSNQSEALSRDLLLLKEQLDLKLEVEEAWRGLFESKAGSQIQYLAAKEARLNASLSYTRAVNAVEQLLSERESLRAERDAFIAEKYSSLAEDYVAASEDVSQLTEEERKVLQQFADLNVASPVSGTVLDMPTLGPGSIVAQGEEILTIVRSDAPLILEVDINPKDRSDLRIGQNASVKFDALPFQQYGDVAGVLAFVSSDTFTDTLIGGPGPVYRGRVEFSQDQLRNLPNGVQISPGMLASSDLLVGDRKLASYFINPIIKNVSNAFREPD